MKNFIKILLIFAIIVSTISAGLAQQQSVRRKINPGPLHHTLTSAGTTHCAGTPGPNTYLATSTTNTSYQLYQWTTPTTAIPIGSPVIGSGTIVNFGSMNDGTYFCIATDLLTGCSDTMINYATITSTSIPTVDIVASGPLTGCGTVSVTLSTPYEAGCTYQWQKNSVDIPFATSTTYSATVTNTTEAYTCIATNSLGCSYSETVVITAHPLPTAFVVSTTTPTFCQGGTGGSVDLSSSLTGTNYQLWLNGSTAVGSPVAGTNAALQWNGLLDPGVYTVVATNPLTGCSATMTGSAILAMDPLPANAGAISGPSTVCQNSTQTYTVGAIANATDYFWAVPAGATILTGQGTPTITVQWNGTSSGNVSVFGNNTCGAGQPSTHYVTVNLAPTLTATSSAAMVCAGNSVTLTASGSTATYTWSGGLGTGSSITITPPLGTTTYTVTATGTNTCQSTSSVTVTVNPLPTVTLALSPTQICSDAGTITLTGGSPAGGTYVGNCVIGGNQVWTSTTPIGTYPIYYEYTDGNSCTNVSSTVNFTVNPIPTVTFIAPTGAIYEDTPPFSLDPYVNPTGGTFSGIGVIGNMFDPNVAGKGTHMIEYTYVHPITGCSATQIQYITVGNVGVDEVAAAVNAIVVFPNPVSNQLNLVNINTQEIVSLQIYDLIGKVVYTTDIHSDNMIIEVSNFQTGAYLLRFSNADGVSVTKRFIKSE